MAEEDGGKTDEVRSKTVRSKKWKTGKFCWVCFGVLAVVLGIAVKLKLSGDEECSLEPRLVRHRPEKAPLGPRAAADPWPVKLGDLQRTSRSGALGPRSLSQPRWSFYLTSITYNTPLIDKSGNIYVVTTGGNIFALDPNGETRWTFKTLAGSPCNPAMQNGTLFTADGAGIAYAVDAETGQVRWGKQFAPRISGGNEAVTVGEGLVIFHYHIGGHSGSWTWESEFVAFNALSGDEIWRSRVDTGFFNVIMAFADGGASLVFSDQSGGTYKMETQTGKLIWTAPGFPFPLTPEASWHGGVGSAPRSHSALALVDVARGVVYGGGNPQRFSGRVRALSLETGAELWSRDLEWMMGNNGALADIDGVPTLVVASGIPCQHPIPESKPPFQGKVLGVHAETGDILWSFDVQPWYYPVAAGSVVNPRCTQINMPDAFNSATIDRNGTVYIGWHGGIIYALDGRNGAVISAFHGGEGPQAQAAIGPSGELIAVGARWIHSFWPEEV